MYNQVIHGDCFEVLKDFPDGSFDAIITDPPYGIGLSYWDVKVDIPSFTTEVKRLLNDGFYAFFGQMPTVIDWVNEANNQKLKYREHIVWCKRATAFIHKYLLDRTFEDIYIYGINKKTFYNVRGDFSDVTPSGILFDIKTIKNIQRTLSYYEQWIKNGEQPLTKIGKIGNCRARDESIYAKDKRQLKRHSIDRNFTNVWSFLPSSQSKRDGNTTKNHPTEKPLELMKRLVEMLTPECGTVLDPFAGSGTTAIACLETGRRYVCIEKEPEYFETMQRRIAEWHNKQLDNNGTHELPEDVERIVPDSGQLSLF